MDDGRQHRKHTLILGLGNTILSDDAAGIIAARRLFEAVDTSDTDFAEASYAGWRLIDILTGYERVIIVDSIVDEQCAPGLCCKVDILNIGSAHLRASHGMGLAEAIALARQNGQPMPERISIYAVGVKNPYEFGEKLSPEVEQRMPDIVKQILDEERLVCMNGELPATS